MNHIYTIYTTLLLMLCGVVACGHDDTFDGGSSSVGDVMSFTIGVNSDQTKSAVSSSAGATSDNISGFAIDVTFEGMESQVATVTRINEYWISNPLYYWETGETKITAYHPATNENSNYPASFTLPTDQSIEENFISADMLWATGEVNIDDYTTYGIERDDIYYIESSKGIGINFSHLFFVCQVYINIDSTYELSTNPIESVSFHDAYTQIDLDQNYGEVDTDSRQTVKFHNSSYVKYYNSTGKGLALFEAIMLPGDYSYNGGEPIISIKSVDGKIFYQSVTLNRTMGDDSGTVQYYQLNLTAESAMPITDSYIEFVRDEDDSANITAIGSNADEIDSILSKFRRCLAKRDLLNRVVISYLDDEDSNYYADGTSADLTGGEGDVMVYMPEYWYLYENVDDTHFRYYISESEIDGGVHVEASLVGAYKGYVESNSYTYNIYDEATESLVEQTVLLNRKLYSRSGVEPTVSLSQSDFIEAAESRGTGHNIIDYYQHCTIAMMLYAKYEDRNTQAHIGNGTAESHTVKSGSTNTLGNRDSDTTTSDYVNGLGIEGVYGGVSEWVTGVTVDSQYIWTITDQTSGEVRTVQAATSAGWCSEIAAESGEYFDMVPTSATGGPTTYYSDYYHPASSATSTYAMIRSYNTAQDNCGVAYCDTEYRSSEYHSYLGSRLSFRGEIIEESDVERFKKLEIY